VKSASEESRCDHVVRGWRLQTDKDAAERARSRGVILGTAAERAPGRDRAHSVEESTETVRSASTPLHAP